MEKRVNVKIKLNKELNNNKFILFYENFPKIVSMCELSKAEGYHDKVTLILCFALIHNYFVYIIIMNQIN